jgi:isoleucyl-tRNA synthetase
LADFPIADSAIVDSALASQVALTRRIVELGRAARAESGVKIRQPLQRALISAHGWAELPAAMKEQIADELNVFDLDDIAGADGDLVDVSVKANFRSLGAKFGGEVQAIAKAITAVAPSELVAQLRATNSYTLLYEGKNYPIEFSDVVITEIPKSGWTVASHEGESVALDLAMTPALIAAGTVREVIRALQEQRKSDGFEISDRIVVKWNGDEATAAAVTGALDHIKEEVLALSMERDAGIAIDSELSWGAKLAKA